MPPGRRPWSCAWWVEGIADQFPSYHRRALVAARRLSCACLYCAATNGGFGPADGQVRGCGGECVAGRNGGSRPAFRGAAHGGVELNCDAAVNARHDWLSRRIRHEFDGLNEIMCHRQDLDGWPEPNRIYPEDAKGTNRRATPWPPSRSSCKKEGPKKAARFFERKPAGFVCIGIPRMLSTLVIPALCLALVLIVVIDCRACERD